MLPEGWRSTTLGQIGRIRSGSTPDRSKQEIYFSDDGWPWVKTMDLTNDQITSTDERITDRALAESSCRLFPPGTVLVAMYGGFKQIGRTGLLTQESAVNQAISAIELDRQVADSTFILHWLNANVDRWRSCAASSRKDPNITREDVVGFSANLPPMAEQKRIVEVLAPWSEAVATAEELLGKTIEQKQALVECLFRKSRRNSERSGAGKRRLSQLIVESRMQGSRGDTAKKITVKLYGRGVVPKDEKRGGSDATQYYRRRAGQFIYSKLDFLNGAFGIIPPELDGYESTLDLPAFDFRDGVDPRWFLYYVSRESFYAAHLGLANGGRKARRVNPGDLLNVAIDVPDLAEQRAIADAIDTAVAEVQAHEKMVSHLKAEKRCLMADLLTGKRRVRLPVAPEPLATPA